MGGWGQLAVPGWGIQGTEGTGPLVAEGILGSVQSVGGWKGASQRLPALPLTQHWTL